MENEIELYEWLDGGAQYERHDDYNVFEERMLDEDRSPKADLYAPGGMKRERYYERDEDDDFDYDADWRHEDAFLDTQYE